LTRCLWMMSISRRRPEILFSFPFLPMLLVVDDHPKQLGKNFGR
jgi:hypothetical protein